MKTALIGSTGFVGANIAASRSFDDHYNSSNLNEIIGREYDLVVSAAGRADSFRINESGAADLAELDALAQVVQQASIKKMVLISTVCVYEASERSDEDTPLGAANLAPYGTNRLHLEQRFQQAFDTTIIRLPQLFGPGLKKGVIYDLANDYRVEHIRPQGVFQYYDLARLWSDIAIALDAGLASLNIATPPLTSEMMARECFGIDLADQASETPESRFAHMYTRNMVTKHADLFGQTRDYLITEEQELEAIRAFAATLERPARSATSQSIR